MIKRKRKRKNPYLADVGYHVTDSSNLQSILDNGFKRGSSYEYFRSDLKVVGDFFFKGRRPIYFLDIPNLNKVTPLMKEHLLDLDLLIKVNVSSYDLQPDYNQLLIDYKFEIFDSVGSVNEVILSKEDIDRKNFFFSIRETNLMSPKYKDLKSLFFKYGNRVNNGTLQPDWYRCVPLKTIKDSEEIKEELIYFTDTFCINKDIPASKILEFYEIEH